MYVKKDIMVNVLEDVTEEDIKAKFKNGTLTLEVNKKDEPKQLPDKKYIDIE